MERKNFFKKIFTKKDLDKKNITEGEKTGEKLQTYFGEMKDSFTQFFSSNIFRNTELLAEIMEGKKKDEIISKYLEAKPVVDLCCGSFDIISDDNSIGLSISNFYYLGSSHYTGLDIANVSDYEGNILDLETGRRFAHLLDKQEVIKDFKNKQKEFAHSGNMESYIKSELNVFSLGPNTDLGKLKIVDNFPIKLEHIDMLSGLEKINDNSSNVYISGIDSAIIDINFGDNKKYLENTAKEIKRVIGRDHCFMINGSSPIMHFLSEGLTEVTDKSIFLKKLNYSSIGDKICVFVNP